MAEINYADFDLLIERSGENTYRVRVLFSPAGQAVCEATLPFSPLELENFLLKIGRTRRGVRRLESPEMEAAKNFGSKLFRSIFQEGVLSTLQSSLDEARDQSQGLRLRLRMNDAPELLNLPWEYLYNPGLNRFLSLSVSTPVVRYLELPERIKPLAIKPPLRMLVMISSPSDYPELDVEREWGNLTTALGSLVQRGLLVMDRLEAATSLELQTRLRRNQYHIFHFIGHGGFNEQSQDGMLLFEEESGHGHPVNGQYLGTLLHDETTLRLAVLNACEGGRTGVTDPFSGVAQSLVQQGLPAVIAMQFEVTDQAAITFAREFYTAIADNYPVDAALAEARKAIFGLGNDIEWGTPVLYMRAPDGVIFDVSKAPQPAQPPLAPEPIVSQPTAMPGATFTPAVQAATPVPISAQTVAAAVVPATAASAAATAGVSAPAERGAPAPPAAKPRDMRLLYALGGGGAVVVVFLLILLWGKIFPASTPPAVAVDTTTPTSELAITPSLEKPAGGAVTHTPTPTTTLTDTPTPTPAATPSVTPTEMLQSQTRGEWIAYAWGRYQKDRDLMLYNIVTGQTRTLTTQHLGDNSPVFSPDGSRLVFTRCPDAGCTLYLMDLKDLSVRSLETPGLDAFFPDWCPDPNKHLLAFEGRGESRRDIWTVNVETGELTQITFGGYDTQPDWSPGCDRVAFGRGFEADDYWEDIFVVNLPSRSEMQITQTKGTDELNVAWSPDGEWLAFARFNDIDGSGFISGDELGAGTLWIASPQGGNEQQLTGSEVSVWSPSWSSDSQRILFASYFAEGSFELWIYSLADGGLSQVTGKGAYYHPLWSP